MKAERNHRGRRREPVLFASALKEILCLIEDGSEPVDAIRNVSGKDHTADCDVFMERFMRHFALMNEILGAMTASGMEQEEAETLMALFLANLMDDLTGQDQPVWRFLA